MCNVYRLLFVYFLLALVLSVLRFTNSDYLFGIFKLFVTELLAKIGSNLFLFCQFGYLDLSHRSICCQILWNYLAFQSFDFERNWLRDRPFNLKRGGRGGYGFLFRSEKIFQTTQVRIFIFLVVLNQIIFFLYQHQNIFFSNIGNQNIFLEKKTIPPSPLKLNGRSLRLFQKRVVYTKLYIYVYIFGNRSILPIS